MYNYKEEKEQTSRVCEHPGCREPAEHRAPKSRSERPDYYWFCLDHVREYNKEWNYFNGMSEDEVERFQRDAPLGHRPTWKHQMDPGMQESILRSKLNAFLGGKSSGSESYTKPVPRRLEKALRKLELEHPASMKQVKSTYKKLVKQYHPDVNGGDTAAEDRFKAIVDAYQLLTEQYGDYAGHE